MVLEHTETTPGGAPSHEPSRWTSGQSRPRWVIATIIVAIVIVAIVWIIRHGTQPQPSMRRMALGNAMAVAVAKATVGDMAVKIPALGTVTPLATVTVRTQISGELQQIAFKEGQMVRQGDFLAQIDPRPYEAALEQAQGNLRRDQALLANAKVDLMRYTELVAQNSIAAQTLDTQKSLVQQYVGTVASDTAQVNTAKLNLQYTHIVSPVSGRVGLRQVDQGNYVTPGDTNGIVVVTQLQPISVVFPIPEDDIPAIMQRLDPPSAARSDVSRPVRSRDPKSNARSQPIDVTALDRSNTTQLADGRLLTADNQIDTSTGTVKLRALFDNKDNALFPNQFVNVELLEQVLHDQVIIPNAAIQHGAPNTATSNFVYLVNSDSTVSVRPVTPGVTDGDKVAVTSGLSAGDVVVTEGGDRLRDGAPVLLPSASPAATSRPVVRRKRRPPGGGPPDGGPDGPPP